MLGCALRCDAVFYPPLHHRQKSFSAYTNPFIRRTSICCEVGHAMPNQGGMKGQTAPGDAHPYLALFGRKKF